jgi:rRNA small subunit pseudouridine methyltransferase Nep1
MDRLLLILADAGLELVPPEISRHPAVVNNAKRRGKKPKEVLLDVSLHYTAMKALKDRWKRGRPDIVHVSLLIAQDSLLNKLGRLETYIHTYQGKVIEISPEMVVPRNYIRFVGLAEQLLLVGRVPPDTGKPLAYIHGKALRDLIKEKGVSKTFRLDDKAVAVKPRSLAKMIVEEKYPALIIGSFQQGDFSEEVESVEAEVYSIFDEPLPAWSVLSHVLALVTDELGVP